jgi:hypothetical protein
LRGKGRNRQPAARRRFIRDSGHPENYIMHSWGHEPEEWTAKHEEMLPPELIGRIEATTVE